MKPVLLLVEFNDPKTLVIIVLVALLLGVFLTLPYLSRAAHDGPIVHRNGGTATILLAILIGAFLLYVWTNHSTKSHGVPTEEVQRPPTPAPVSNYWDLSQKAKLKVNPPSRRINQAPKRSRGATFYAQIGAYATYERAAWRLQDYSNLPTQVVRKQNVYKALVGPFADRAETENFLLISNLSTGFVYEAKPLQKTR